MNGLRFYLQGWVELLARYRAVWGHAWQRRHEMTPPARTADELAFLPAALALQEAPVSPIPRVTAWLLMSFALLALLWACFGQIDIVATAQGKVVPSDRIKTIQPMETATVKAIHVSEGQEVKAGDLLLELDRMEFDVYETGERVKARQRPVVIITSNNEKELPDAFLRRCFFHYIRFPDKAEMQAIVKLHYPNLKERLLDEAMTLFFELRAVEGLRKKPSTSELLDWIRLLLADDIAPEALRTREPGKLVPALYGALLKTEQDLHLFEKLAFLARRGG